MSDQHYYLYAFARPDCSVEQIGAGVDPRFEVEVVCDGSTAAVASRVGLDRFDVKKLEGGTAEDIGWLNQVAVRHHDIVRQAAESSPVLPLRLGTIFLSRASLLAAAARARDTVADFLRTLGDRQEWAVKLFLENPSVETTAGQGSPPRSDVVQQQRPSLTRGRGAGAEGLLSQNTQSSLDGRSDQTPRAGAGAEYLNRRKAQLQRHRELRAGLQEEIQVVEEQLRGGTDGCCRGRLLPASLTGRSEKMVFNAAFLLDPSQVEAWLATVERVRESVRCKGLLLEATGPSPPYHFCPTPEL